VIEEEYLQFVHRFRFTGASNHPQAAAITALWRRHLRLNELFEDLHTEITSATEYLFNRATSRGAATAERLTIIGTLGLLGALTFSFLGMNILTEPTDLGSEFRLLLATLHLNLPNPPRSSHVTRLMVGETALLFFMFGGFCVIGSIMLGTIRQMKRRELGLGKTSDRRNRDRRPAELDQKIAFRLMDMAAASGLISLLGFAISWWLQGG